jgi:hypothetical protein
MLRLLRPLLILRLLLPLLILRLLLPLLLMPMPLHQPLALVWTPWFPTA